MRYCISLTQLVFRKDESFPPALESKDQCRHNGSRQNEPTQFMVTAVTGMNVGRDRLNTQYQFQINAKVLIVKPTQKGPAIFQDP